MQDYILSSPDNPIKLLFRSPEYGTEHAVVVYISSGMSAAEVACALRIATREIEDKVV